MKPLAVVNLCRLSVICKNSGDLEDRILETAEDIGGPVDKAKARALRKQRELEKSKKALERDWRLNEDCSKFAGTNAASTVRIGTKVAAAQRLNFQASMRVSISCWWIFVYFSNFCGAEKVADALKQNRSIATIDMVRITIFFSIFPKWFGDAEKLTKALFSFASKTVHWLLFKVDKGKRKSLNAKEFTGVMQDIEVGVNIEKLKPVLAARW
ncbi:unnamed protein product [Microthlaspi erraticum]|uniref:Uncharacterized protein n=1 Tax=Microthlaspi erraticum TaxID=1685480 RepID=A0A6D2I9C1_9BRAS|nr:unnamed protein product [Microthlaspi erraticum]